MTPGDLPAPVTRAPRLRVDRYVLDLDRGCLLLDGNEIALRPKTFAVLRYLVENAGRLVSKDELFAAVWPNLAVTDDTLVQSIGELRRALGSDGARLIRTVARRGYRFESSVAAIAPHDPAAGHVISLPASAGAAAPSHSRMNWRHVVYAAAAAIMLAAGVFWLGPYLAPHAPRVDHAPAAAGGAATKPDATRPVIAVLPFLNRSDDATRDYFADGLTQDIIGALGRFSELTVMSWNAVVPYKSQAASPADIARGLGVRYQVEGSVRQTGDRVRVNAQLVDTGGRVLWSASFDEALADIFELQDRIATQITGTLALRITQAEQQRVFAKPTDSLEAYDYVLRARPALQRPTRANLVEARSLLRRAIDLDPNYAGAYAALAESYYVATSLGFAEQPAVFLARAEELASKAVSLDPGQVRAHVILGRMHILHQRYTLADAEIERAIAANPNDALGLAGRGNIRMWLGQTDDAVEALEQAQRIDPDLNPMDRFALSLAYYLKRRYPAAIDQAELNLRANPEAGFSRIVLAASYAQEGRSEDAARVADTIRRTDPTFDPAEFGSKFLNAADLDHVREGVRKAGLDARHGDAPHN